MTHPVKSPRKLIEVALPLDAINTACRREKSIRYGHPSTMHLWWARRPLAAARALIFAQLVNDPGYQQGRGFKYGVNKEKASKERKRLFKIVEELVKWENIGNQKVLEEAKTEIARSWREVCELNKDHPQASELFNPDRLPSLHDPFAGGGTIPLEAQRLGLEAIASDLNPVAVLINKAMIEMPAKYTGQRPIGPLPKTEKSSGKLELDNWTGLEGLAEDIFRYSDWIRQKANQRIGCFYPDVEVDAELVSNQSSLRSLEGHKLTVIAWLWARTVKSPNPALSEVHVPLCSSFVLSTRKGKEHYLVPKVDGNKYCFDVGTGVIPAEAKSGTKASGRGANFRCLISGVPIANSYIKKEAKAGRMRAKLLAVVLLSPHGRVYVPGNKDMEELANSVRAEWSPQTEFFQQALGFRIGNYGMTKWADLFTERQLLALNTFTDLVVEVRETIRKDAESSQLEDPEGYADAVTMFLALGVSRSTSMWSSNSWWQPSGEFIAQVFTRQAIPMIWDFAECNPFSEATGNWNSAIDWITRVIKLLPSRPQGRAIQHDAAKEFDLVKNTIISTDPPYFDNVGYADLSDFYYVWLRRSLRSVFPNLFATLSTPKQAELVATPARHGGRKGAEEYFLNGMTEAMCQLASEAHPSIPVSIYYAFKQSETNDDTGTTSSGWETFLDSVIRAGFAITGTWPVRTEREGGVRNNERNSLASSVVLICRIRPADAPAISRREFIRELNAVLPDALDEMTKGSADDVSPVAPVDLSQAIIGPGMSVFSKYSAVLEADGSPMEVRKALELINRFLAEDDFDPDTQFCLHWMEQFGWKEGPFGEGDTLARAKGTSVDGVKFAGVIESGGGSIRLLRWQEYPSGWDPQNDRRNPVWETLHHLIRVFRSGGETEAGKLLSLVRVQAETVRQLAYRLYTICERGGLAEDARAYNELITSWTGIESASGAEPVGATQLNIFD